MNGDKIVVITGAYGAIGTALAFRCAREGYSMILTGRNSVKLVDLKDKILKDCPDLKIETLHVDLSSRESIINLVSEINKTPIWALVNNGAVLAPKFELSYDGYEMNGAVNFIGAVYLSMLLKDNFIENGRIVNVVSCTTKISQISSKYISSLKENSQPNYNRIVRYGESKLALKLVSAIMAKKFNGITVACADPGVVNTPMISMGKWYDPLADILFRPFIKSPHNGSLPLFRALTSNSSDTSKPILYSGKDKISTLNLTSQQYNTALALFNELSLG